MYHLSCKRHPPLAERDATTRDSKVQLPCGNQRPMQQGHHRTWSWAAGMAIMGGGGMMHVLHRHACLRMAGQHLQDAGRP
jgi:hypothetical protein